MTEPLILGVDPGLLVTGWAIMVGRIFLDGGSIRLPKNFKGDRVFEAAARFRDQLGKLTGWCPTLTRAAVERYAYQGKARAVNPAGIEVAELAREIASECRHAGLDTMLLTRNDALRAMVPNQTRRYVIPSEKSANTYLQAIVGKLPNQHVRDAAMQCWAARQRWRAGR